MGEVNISKDITFGVGSLEMFVYKKLQDFASELGFKFGVMRGFQKVITLGGGTSGGFHILGLQK